MCEINATKSFFEQSVFHVFRIVPIEILIERSKPLMVTQNIISYDSQHL